MNFIDCQQQSNSVDCGVYAITYSYQLLRNGLVELNFDKESIRPHLLQKLSYGKSIGKIHKFRCQNDKWMPYCPCKGKVMVP